MRHSQDHRLADRHHHPQQRLEELDRSAAGGRYRRRRRQAQAGHAAAAGPCRSGRRLKYNFHDARYILERASARETAARVAVGALAKALLGQFGIRVLSHVIAVGEVRLDARAAWEELVALSQKERSAAGLRRRRKPKQRMKAVVDQAYRTGDTVGGVFEVVAHGVPPGLGSHITWDSRLDGRLAQAIVSMQAVKGVEIGFAAEGAASFGSNVQDTIHYNREERRFTRGANRAGGLEGGMTNGQDVLVRGLLKPISTLRRPLESVDLATREPALAAYERSDVCVVPAAGVIGEAMVAIVLAQAFLEKFGGDSLDETRRNFEGYLEQVKKLLMIYPIVLYGEPVLEKQAEAVTEFDTPELHQAGRRHVRIHVRGQGRGSGRAADRHRQAHRRDRSVGGRRSAAEDRADQSRDHSQGRNADRRRRLPEHSRFSRAGDARPRASPCARRTSKAKRSK